MNAARDSESHRELGIVYAGLKRVEAVARSGSTLAWIDHHLSTVVFLE